MCNDYELSNMRRAVSERLDELDLQGEDSHSRLSAICTAIYEPSHGWTAGACEALKSKLLMILATDAMQHVDITDPITGELRQSMVEDGMHEGELRIGAEHFDDLCDAIDAVHMAVEVELAEANVWRGRLAEDLRKANEFDGRRWKMAEFATLWKAIPTYDYDAQADLLDEYAPIIWGEG